MEKKNVQTWPIKMAVNNHSTVEVHIIGKHPKMIFLQPPLPKNDEYF